MKTKTILILIMIISAISNICLYNDNVKLNKQLQREYHIGIECGIYSTIWCSNRDRMRREWRKDVKFSDGLWDLKSSPTTLNELLILADCWRIINTNNYPPLPNAWKLYPIRYKYNSLRP
jgi:hypothetical protein